MHVKIPSPSFSRNCFPFILLTSVLTIHIVSHKTDFTAVGSPTNHTSIWTGSRRTSLWSRPFLKIASATVKGTGYEIWPSVDDGLVSDCSDIRSRWRTRHGWSANWSDVSPNCRHWRTSQTSSLPMRRKLAATGSQDNCTKAVLRTRTGLVWFICCGCGSDRLSRNHKKIGAYLSAHLFPSIFCVEEVEMTSPIWPRS